MSILQGCSGIREEQVEGLISVLQIRKAFPDKVSLYPGLPEIVLVLAYCPGITMCKTLLHSQRHSSLEEKSYGYSTY